MIQGPLLEFKSRLTAHLAVRDVRIQLAKQLENGEKTLALLERHQKFLSRPRSDITRKLYSDIARQGSCRDTEVYDRLIVGMKVSNKRLSDLITLYEGNNAKVLITSSISTINASALQMAALCDFQQKMCHTILMSATELESLAFRGIRVPRELAKYMDRNLGVDRIRSLGSLISYNRKVENKDVVAQIRQLDDVEVSEETLIAANAMNGSKSITASFNYLNLVLPNFWAYVGLKITSELSLMYLDLQKEELEMLERRHQELSQLKERGEADLATNKLIGKLQDRIDIKRYDIKEHEARLG